ncbi:MAG: amidohydrolase [Dehalococcoidia bacterium]|nr:amidohydrolase [Dehalococcoidia bacterium]
MIVDTHTHIFPAWLRERRQEYLKRDATFGALYSNPTAKMATAEELVAAMDAAGIDVAVVLGLGWSDPGLTRECNDELTKAARRFPQRLLPFCSVNPAWGDAAVYEVERCARLGARGVGELHPDTQGFDLGSQEVMEPLVEAVERLGLLLLTHSSEPVGHPYSGKGTTTPAVLMRFISNFPSVTLICAHWGGGLPFYALMPEVAAALQNVYFDTAASPFLYNPHVFSVASQLVPPTHILLGTDYPLLAPARVLDQIRTSELSQETRDAILGGNAARLLGLTPSPSSH